MTRSPPRLLIPGSVQRSFRTPPEPEMIFPASGFCIMNCCSSEYSSSSRYTGRTRSNTDDSMKVNIAAGVRHWRIIRNFTDHRCQLPQKGAETHSSASPTRAWRSADGQQQAKRRCWRVGFIALLGGGLLGRLFRLDALRIAHAWPTVLEFTLPEARNEFV